MINEIGFRGFASFTDGCKPDKNRKTGEKKFSVFSAGSIFWLISWVMGVINEIGFQ